MAKDADNEEGKKLTRLEKKKLKLEKKEEKQREREEKRIAKLVAKGVDPADIESADEDSIGSKIAIFVVTLVIIAIWLAILALLIRWDVGGFGSTVLKPILKDVPYLNMILPEDEEEIVEQNSTEDTEYPYSSIAEAINRIKELEIQVEDLKAESAEKDAQLAELSAVETELAAYKAYEAEFEALKQKFDEEVVFSDQAPDIEEYKTFYESIEPENAETLYKQVLEQIQTDEEIEDYVKTYSSMKPKAAAAVFDTMTNNLDLVAKILNAMDAESRANIMNVMDSEVVAKLTAIMEPDK
ncbi:MAG: hypothetical protein K6E13_05420 [Lachnospiraceae bacterium]|nr:hypothetical protein [Lachnospiraceae bacterium]